MKTTTTLRDHYAILDGIRGETTRTIIGADRPRVDRARKALALPPLQDGDDVASGLAPTLSEQLAAYRDAGALPVLYAAKPTTTGEQLYYVHAAGLKPGDRIDLEDDIYADGAVHGEGGSEYQYEYAVVESIKFETAYTVVVHTHLTSFACPPDHRLPLELCDTCEGRGYFANAGGDGSELAGDSALVVTRCDTCDRFAGDLEAGRHVAKLRGWTFITTAIGTDGKLAPLDEGSVHVSDGEAPAFAWIGDLIYVDDAYSLDAPVLPEFRIRRLRGPLP